jgi:hypothetical protein
MSAWKASGSILRGQLNAVNQSTADILGSSIHLAPEKKDGKDITISFAKAAAQENNCESITSV